MTLRGYQNCVKIFHENIGDACRHALGDLGLANSRIAFDELRFGHQLGVDGVEIVDGYDPLMYARSVKTSQEIGFLQRGNPTQSDSD